MKIECFLVKKNCVPEVRAAVTLVPHAHVSVAQEYLIFNIKKK